MRLDDYNSVVADLKETRNIIEIKEGELADYRTKLLSTDESHDNKLAVRLVELENDIQALVKKLEDQTAITQKTELAYNAQDHPSYIPQNPRI